MSTGGSAPTAPLPRLPLFLRVPHIVGSSDLKSDRVYTPDVESERACACPHTTVTRWKRPYAEPNEKLRSRTVCECYMSTHGAPRLIKLAPTHSSSSIHG